MPVFRILEDNITFPHPSLANRDGLLGIGGDLSLERLLLAYQNGIFPWNNEGEPISWWCLTPRLILRPNELKISKSMKSVINDESISITYDGAFSEVILKCSLIKRKNQDGTWIYDELRTRFTQLFDLGIAHSVEVWKDKRLCGGLYGLLIGRMFCGESMFADESNMSKLALVHLCKKLVKLNIDFIDCQQETAHLKSLGAEPIQALEFFEFLDQNKKYPLSFEKW